MATAHPTTGAPTPDEVTLRPVDWALLAVPGLVWGSSFYLIAVGLETLELFYFFRLPKFHGRF